MLLLLYIKLSEQEAPKQLKKLPKVSAADNLFRSLGLSSNCSDTILYHYYFHYARIFFIQTQNKNKIHKRNYFLHVLVFSRFYHPSIKSLNQIACLWQSTTNEKAAPALA